MSDQTPTSLRQVFQVSELLRDVRTLLERSFASIWVEGELSNLARPASGHWYFSLKDGQGQLRAAMFRQRNRLLTFSPADGDRVRVRGRISLYEARGDFQMLVDHMEPAGEGALRQAYDALLKRLRDEGLFEPARKQALPVAPRRIGVITSPSGAAIRDVLTVLARRSPTTEVIIYPVQVQGQEAPAQIRRALAVAQQRAECDVLLLTRGGGSLEDLWSFNDEALARDIAACTLPVVAAVGHEIDFTIADFVADQRAPTPSAAAELLSTDRSAVLQSLNRLEQRLWQQMRRGLDQGREKLQGLAARIQHPQRVLEQRGQRVDELTTRLVRAQSARLNRDKQSLATLIARLRQHTPGHRLAELEQRRRALQDRLIRAQAHLLSSRKQTLAGLSRALDAVSPLNTLGRGYAIVRRPDTGVVLQRAADVQPGERVEARLREGRLICVVEENE